MKKLFFLGMALVWSVIMAVAPPLEAAPEWKGEIKIGAATSASGIVADTGGPIRDGAKFAVEEINKAGGILGRKVEFIFRDPEGKPERAVTLAKELCVRHKVDFAITDIISGCSRAQSAVYQEYKTPAVIVGAMAMEIMQLGNPYYMRIVSNTEVNGRAMAIAARHGNYKRPAIIYLNDYFGNSLRKIMEKEMALMSLEIVSSQSFDTYTTDMGPQVMKILAAKPDLVFLIAYAGDAVTALRTFKAQGYKGNYVGYSAMQHNATRAGAGYDVDGILFPSGNHTQGFYIWNRPGVIPLLLKLEAANPVGKYRLVNASPELSMLDGYQAIYTYKAWIELTGERGLKDKDYFMDVVAKSKINSFCYNLSFPQGRAMMEAFTIQDAYLRIYDKGHMRMWNADPRCIETFEATRVQAEEEIYGKGFTEGVTFRKYLARWQELLREKEAKVKGEIDEKLQKKIITDEYASMFKQALGEILAYKF